MEYAKIKERLIQRVSEKLTKELDLYKEKILSKGLKEVFDHAYEIDSYINIYEMLLIKIEYLEIAQLYRVALLPHILGFFYEQWLETEDTVAEQFCEAIDMAVKRELNMGVFMNIN